MEQLHHLDQRRMDGHQRQGHRGVERGDVVLLYHLE